MKKSSCNIAIVILIVFVLISSLVLLLVYDDRFGSGGYDRSVWFTSTDPDNKYTITAVKSEINSPAALYADVEVTVNITNKEINKLVQSFTTRVDYASDKNYRVEYNDRGITLSFYDNDELDSVFTVSYESLSMLSAEAGGDEQ